jgi:hypothetical protein
MMNGGRAIHICITFVTNEAIANMKYFWKVNILQNMYSGLYVKQCEE